MELDRRDVEFLYPDLASVPTGAQLTVSFDGGESWAEVTVDEGTPRVLVAGPDATGVHPAAVVLPLGTSRVIVRSIADPEHLHRYAGVIDVL
jgi:hypothetical protein